MSQRPEVGLVVVAAGAGRRLGGAAKALLRGPDGETFLAAIAASARAAGVRMDRAIVVVAEPHRAATAAEAERLGLATVENPAPERGMGSSVAVGFAAAVEAAWEVAAALLWPVDMPLVRAATVARLCAEAAPGRSVVPALDGRGGHPVAVGRDLWPALAGCASLPEGARSALRGAPSLRLAVEDRGVVADVDDAAALAALRDAR